MSDYKPLPPVFPRHNLQLHHLNTSDQLKPPFQKINSNTHPIHYLQLKIPLQHPPLKLTQIPKPFPSQNK